ncbi:MAG: PAS domain S-box-containing protein [Motiliproteus sp.]|jgi:PAS domain S-box-containing protein
MKSIIKPVMKGPTLTTRLVTVLIVVFTGFVLITALSINGLREALLHEKKHQTRYLVENAHSLFEHLYGLSRSTDLTEAQAKERAIDTIRALRYDQDNYFWINDMQSKMLMHPILPALDGQDLSSLKDTSGKLLVIAFVDTVRQHGEGFVGYYWPKPGAKDPVEKLSFVKGFKPWGWIIGSGIYVDDVQKAFFNSALFLGLISSSILLLVVTGALIIRREAGFQKTQYGLIAQTNARLEQQVSDRTAALREANSALTVSRDLALQEHKKLVYSEAIFRSMAETAQDAIILIDEKARVVYWNASAERIFGYTACEVQGKDLHQLIAKETEQAKFRAAFPTFTKTGRSAMLGKILELTARRKSGEAFPVELSINGILINQSWSALGIVRDISNRKLAERTLLDKTKQQAELIDQLQAAQEQLLQSEKLAAIGQLSAGVAHEINNPVGFIGSNINSAKSYVEQFIRMLEQIKLRTAALKHSEPGLRLIAEAESEFEFEYLRGDLVELFTETKEGVDRIQKIIADLKGFARASDGIWEEVDLHQEIDSTLNVIWNELKYHCCIEKHYGVLPQVQCLRSEINQVIMNLLINASQAIEDQGTINIRTGADQSAVWIAIEDNGQGIDPGILHKIFDPFFTTKPVGKGTGLGLSVSYGIVEKHSGRLEVLSTPGLGTTFTLRLPIEHPQEAAL